MSHFKKQISLHGLRAYLSRLNALVARGPVASGGESSIGRQGGTVVLPGSPGTVALFHDFLGHLADTGGFDGWEFVNGDNDTGATGSIGYVSATNGVIRLNGVTSMQPAPAHNLGLASNAMQNWKANQGNLRFAARVKLPSLATANVYVGFSDSGGADMPAYDTGTNAAIGFLSNMTNGAGFMFGPGGSSTAWRPVATAGDSDQVASGGTSASPTANTYDVLEIEFSPDSGQVVDFYVNGVNAGRISNPVNAAAGLVPGFWMFSNDTGTTQLDIDWVNVSANRDTGT
jgi:hypothetical protein